MSNYDYDLICIGSGPAGQRAAIQAAKLGKRVAVIERQRWIGGVCVDRGTIPSKTFREAVISYTGYGRRFIPSQEKVIGPKVTSELLLGGVSRVVHDESEIVERQLRRNDVELTRGVASFEGPHTVLVSSESGSHSISSEKILIAVGSRAVLSPEPDIDREIVVTSDDLPFLKRLPRTLTVIGAGVIGIEYASIFAALGIEVSVVDRRSRLLEFVDYEIVDELMHQMRAMNVAFRLEESVANIETADDARKRGIIHLESGKRIVGDLILYSVGRVGAIDELHLE
jgi:NAD(P) transhydrogenase